MVESSRDKFAIIEGINDSQMKSEKKPNFFMGKKHGSIMMANTTTATRFS